MDQPTTFNEAITQACRDEMKVFKDARRRFVIELAIDEEEKARGDRFTTGRAREDKIAKYLKDPKFEEDTYSTETDAMGRVRGYYNIASANIVDTVAKLMRRDLFRESKEELVKFLQDEFKLFQAEGEELLAARLLIDGALCLLTNHHRLRKGEGATGRESQPDPRACKIATRARTIPQGPSGD